MYELPEIEPGLCFPVMVASTAAGGVAGLNFLASAFVLSKQLCGSERKKRNEHTQGIWIMVNVCMTSLLCAFGGTWRNLEEFSDIPCAEQAQHTLVHNLLFG